MINEVIVNLNIFGTFVEDFIVSNLNEVSFKLLSMDWSYKWSSQFQDHVIANAVTKV